ncbi:hypothetical protein CFOL_v3_27422 [Cephalotus follicularis]|uniref:Uncharacterized protein n=1 Tax=Cephalotus follicularis TaxID=3775 RepID=A0A1Q3CUS1_CEPFO|nr:hypothetical protein CFOL_v3_27422 [Cephalotus follicularis]
MPISSLYCSTASMLLGWMHRKFCQGSIDQRKDFGIGQSSLENHQECYTICGTKFFRQAQRDHQGKSFAASEAARVPEEYCEEESSEISELFHGFLAIGTLGLDIGITDPSTPTFSLSLENITKKKTEVTENELKFFNDKLQKVLGTEGKDDGCNDSSARNSHVSSGRSSHGSTITLSGKILEAPESNGNGTVVCPLQGYLFGSAIELSETTVAKKEHRTSLGELFQRAKIEEQREDKRSDKAADKSAAHVLKKLLKKKLIHASRSYTAGTAATADSASAEKKLHKILHMFHRKVHPEKILTATQKQYKHQRHENKKKISYDGGHEILQDEDTVTLPHRALVKETIRCYKSESNPPSFTFGGSDSNGNREHWVKTDADYLVLEL